MGVAGIDKEDQAYYYEGISPVGPRYEVSCEREVLQEFMGLDHWAWDEFNELINFNMRPEAVKVLIEGALKYQKAKV